MNTKSVSKMNLPELNKYESFLRKQLDLVKTSKGILAPEIYFRTKNKIPQYFQLVGEYDDGFKLRKLKSKVRHGKVVPTRVFDGKLIIETNLSWWYRYFP